MKRKTLIGLIFLINLFCSITFYVLFIYPFMFYIGIVRNQRLPYGSFYRILIGAIANCVVIYVSFIVFKFIVAKVKTLNKVHCILKILLFSIVTYIFAILLGMFLSNSFPSSFWISALSVFFIAFALPLGHYFWLWIFKIKQKDHE